MNRNNLPRRVNNVLHTEVTLSLHLTGLIWDTRGAHGGLSCVCVRLSRGGGAWGRPPLKQHLEDSEGSLGAVRVQAAVA